MTSQQYYNKIMEEIKTGNNLFDHINFGILFSAGEGLVAKVFGDYSTEEAIEEFDNLLAIEKLNDPRIKVPKVYDYICLGTSQELEDQGLEMFLQDPDAPVYAVVMEHLKGKQWCGTNNKEKKHYHQSLIDLIDGLVENKMEICDFKESELICLEGTNKVGFVDTHILSWNDEETSHDSYAYKTIYDDAKKYRPLTKKIYQYFSNKIKRTT